ncbi:Smr/MutS family protein [Patescibacteria group bacterium]|nr:Smr/MutS family protein [Patescibacteria group bacterium]
MKRRRQKASTSPLPIPQTERARQEELLWIAEHGDPPTLDLHGLSSLSAEHILAQFVYDAQYHLDPVVVIVHGHGTGALKKMAEQWLKAHPELIALFRPGLTARRAGALVALLR